MPKIKVPSEIIRLAKKAIDENNSLPISQRASYKQEGDKKVPGTGMRTARRLVSGAVDREQLELMRAWFARHGESIKEKEARKDKTSKAARAWMLWGGSPGMRWVRMVLREMEEQERKK